MKPLNKALPENKKLRVIEILLISLSALCLLFITSFGLAAAMPENPFMYFYKKFDGVNPVYVGLGILFIGCSLIMFVIWKIKK